MDYQQFLFTITAGLQSSYSADEKVTVQTTEQKHTAKIKTVYNDTVFIFAVCFCSVVCTVTFSSAE